MIEFFKVLIESDPNPTFPVRFAARNHGSKNRYLATIRDELYPGRPDHAETRSAEVSPGWFLGTKYGKTQMETIIELACEVAALRFGEDIVINLGQ